MSNQRILGFAYVAASVLVFLVMRQFVDWLFDTIRLTNYAFGPFTISDVLALLIVVGAAVATWKYPKVYGFLTEVVEETSKVVWPSRQETRDSTVVVIVFVFVIAAILGSFDLLWAKVTNLILSGPAA
jgi:preprotein translocase subunit SecE